MFGGLRVVRNPTTIETSHPSEKKHLIHTRCSLPNTHKQKHKPSRHEDLSIREERGGGANRVPTNLQSTTKMTMSCECVVVRCTNENSKKKNRTESFRAAKIPQTRNQPRKFNFTSTGNIIYKLKLELRFSQVLWRREKVWAMKSAIKW